jgi:NhaC family Na+:H+ antiporter
MAAALGISTLSFAPFCFFNLLNPLVTIVFTVVGLRVVRSASRPAEMAKQGG